MHAMEKVTFIVLILMLQPSWNYGQEKECTGLLLGKWKRKLSGPVQLPKLSKISPFLCKSNTHNITPHREQMLCNIALKKMLHISKARTVFGKQICSNGEKSLLLCNSAW